MNFGEKFRRFLAGRYGMDALNKAIFIVTLILLVLLWFFPNRFLELAVLILLVIGYFRFLSRNIPARYRENRLFLEMTGKPRRFFRKRKYRFDQRQTYRFFRCPKCRQEVRVPRGKGKISITCPKCGERFVKKS